MGALYFTIEEVIFLAIFFQAGIVFEVNRFCGSNPCSKYIVVKNVTTLIEWK